MHAQSYIYFLAVENVCPEVLLQSTKKDVTNISHLLLKKFKQLKELNISNCTITHQGADVVAMIISKCLSLKQFDVSNTNLCEAKFTKIARALMAISSMKCLRMSNNAVGKQAVECLKAVIGSNSLIEELYLCNNNLTFSGITQIIDALSKCGAMKILDISKNCIDISNTSTFIKGLTGCSTLQKLDLSCNSLMFSDVLRIAQALRNHPSLQVLNMEDNITSFFSECEFLVDIIMSTNPSLLNLNVCGRNIRLRLTVEYLIPPCIHEQYKNFIIQDLYLSHYLLLGCISPSIIPERATERTCSNPIKATKTCPLAGAIASYYYVDHNGGTFYNEAHNFAIVIPPGAVVEGMCIEMQAAASRFGPYNLPKDCYQISNFFWVSANYTFKIPVYLILSHHASLRTVSDIYKLCALEACARRTAEERLLMNKVLGEVSFDYKLGFGVIPTDHFCTYCLGKNDMNVPDKVLASFYMYKKQESIMAEICMCLVNKECIEVSI